MGVPNSLQSAAAWFDGSRIPDSGQSAASLVRAVRAWSVPPAGARKGLCLADRQGPGGLRGMPLAGCPEDELAGAVATLEAANPEPELVAVLDAQSPKLAEPVPQPEPPRGLSEASSSGAGVASTPLHSRAG